MTNRERFEQSYRRHYKAFWRVPAHDSDVAYFMGRASTGEYVSLHQTCVQWTLDELGIPGTIEALCAYLTMG